MDEFAERHVPIMFMSIGLLKVVAAAIVDMADGLASHSAQAQSQPTLRFSPSLAVPWASHVGATATALMAIPGERATSASVVPQPDQAHPVSLQPLRAHFHLRSCSATSSVPSTIGDGEVLPGHDLASAYEDACQPFGRVSMNLG